MFECFILFPNGKIFFPNPENITYKRADGVIIADTLADGLYAKKYKYGNRYISFTARFDLATGVLFQEASKIKREVKFFDAKNFSVPINIIISELNYSNEYVIGLNFCNISVNAVETNPLIPIPTETITALSVISAINVISTGISAAAILNDKAAQNIILNLKTLVTDPFLLNKIKVLTGTPSVAQILDIHKSVIKNMRRNVQKQSTQSQSAALSSILEEEEPGNEGNIHISLALNFFNNFYVFNVIKNINFLDYSFEYFVNVLKNLNVKLESTRQNEENITQNYGVKNSEIILSTINYLCENIVKSKHKQKIIFSFDKDIYLAVSEILPSLSPVEFERNLSKFIKDNNITGDELFLLKKNKKYYYYV